MSWFNVWDGLKNKTCRYLLQRYLGQFLQGRINLEQMKVDLFNGRATVKDVSLKVDVLNELFEAQGWSLEIIEGYIGELTVIVPWNALMTSDTFIEVSDLCLTVRPVKRQSDGISTLESMWSSVSSSMQLAEECMKQNDGSETAQELQTTNIVGLEKFAETIDNVLNRIKAKFHNTRVRVEYQFNNLSRGIAIITSIQLLNYKNDTNEKHLEKKYNNNDYDDDNDNDNGGRIGDVNEPVAGVPQIHSLPSFAKHSVYIDGLRFFTEEFVVNECEAKSSEDESEYMQRCEKADISQPIPVLEIKGLQKIEIKMKQSEDIPGPKIYLDVELGKVYTLLTPRQVHLFAKFYDTFCEEQDDASALNLRRSNSSCGVIKSCDDMGTKNAQMSGILNHGNWASAADYDEQSTASYQMYHNLYRETEMPTASTRSELYCDSFSSSISSSSLNTTSTTRFQRRMANTDSCGEILNFNVRLASLEAILLHEDILVEANRPDMCSLHPFNEKTHMDMVKLAEDFFANCLQNGNSQSDAAFEMLNEKNHLYLYLSPVFGEGIQQRNKSCLLFKVAITATKFDFYEVLDGNSTSLIKFDRSENCSDGYHKRPELHVQLKSTSYSKSKITVTTTINIELEKCNVELDISIYDRLSALLGSTPYNFNCYDDTSNDEDDDNLDEDRNSLTDDKSLTEIKIESRLLDAKLRFPIVDARPIHDANRCPWWKKNIRADFLLCTLTQLCLKFCSKTVEIVANEINAFYCEPNSSPVHILKTIMTKESLNTLSYPKICIKIPTAKDLNNISIEMLKPEDLASSFYMSSSTLSPFSSKRVCRQSDAVHSDDEYETVLLPGEKEEMLKFTETTMKMSKIQIKINIPALTLTIGSKLLYEKIYNRLNTDLLMWEPSSPLLKKIPTNVHRQMFQSVLNVDLMTSIYASSTLLENTTTSTQMTKKRHTIVSDSSSDTEQEITNDESDTESVYFSINEKIQQQHQPQQQYRKTTTRVAMKTTKPSKTTSATTTTTTAAKKHSFCSIEIIVDKGSVSLFMPVRDAENRVLPGQAGRIHFIAEKLNIFCVSGYASDNNLNYVCLQSNNVECFHCGQIPVDVPQELSAEIGSYMQSTLYAVPAGLTKGQESLKAKKRENISFVVEIKKLPEQRIKLLRLTTGIHKLAVRHSPCLVMHNWLKQLIEFLDVVDYPIEGYRPFDLITEIQLHLWDCAVDYRPLSFNYRAVVEIGSFNICSNVIPSVAGCNLRFVFEDCVLSLAEYDKTKYNLPDWRITCIPAKNLIPVLELGLLDISLRLCDGTLEQLSPKLDFRCSVHDAHLRTCADSGSALAQLIAHLANDGDVMSAQNDDNNPLSLQSSAYSDAELFSSNSTIPEISKQQQEHVNNMMAEAVRDTVRGSLSSMQSSYSSSTSSSIRQETGIEVFYFPDETQRSPDDDEVISQADDVENKTELCDILNFESNVMLTSYYNNKADNDNEEALPQIKADLGDIMENRIKNIPQEVSSQEEDYCIIAEEEKVFMYNFGIKSLNISEDPLRIVDNHFCLPSAKQDLLLAPENFPIAQSRYTLCEMNFTWHLYGGKDFDGNSTSPQEQHPETKNVKHSNMSEAYKYGVSYSKSQQRIRFDQKPKDKITWKTAGGKERNHEILVEIQLSKVRFSHEEYPTYTSQASRQVLLVGEFEIRDRLQSSEINKFLYHPKNKGISPKGAQNMLVVKALHVRPNPTQSRAQECSLRISLLPLRLHIDQDTLLFIAEYFTSMENTCNTESADTPTSSNTHKMSTVPIMSVDEVPEAVQDLHARHMVATNLDLLMDNQSTCSAHSRTSIAPPLVADISSEASAPVYFREIIFSPDVLICFDYHGRRVEMSRGPIAGLLMGLGQLHCSEIILKKVIYRRGILGMEKLLTFLCKEWLKDIKRNQLPKILSGVGPTHAFVQLFKGIYDLFWLPLEQYQKDGRIIRGLQLGAQSFTARTVLAALEITSRIIHILQFTAETTFDMVSAGPSIRRSRKIKRGKKKRPHHPTDIREGVANAYMIVKEGINESANTLIETTASEHDRKGYTGAVGAVMRQIPQLVICPAVLATQATTNILSGVKSSLVPGSKIEAREKWKDETD